MYLLCEHQVILLPIVIQDYFKVAQSRSIFFQFTILVIIQIESNSN